MRIKLFEELKRQTYLSAADKLLSKGHKDRANRIYKHSDKYIDRLDVNKYYINSDIKWAEGKITKVDGIFQIVDLVELGVESPVGIFFQSGSTIVEVTYGAIGDSGKFFWIKQIKPNKTNYWAPFKFTNRKDARNFKSFLIDQLPEYTYFKDVHLNDMYI